MRLDGGRGLTELTSGVDALYLSGAAAVPAVLVDDLKAARDESRESRGATPLELAGVTFGIAGSGLGRYPFRLEHAFAVVGLTESVRLPALRVQFRASYLHAVGVMPALTWLDSVFEPILGQIAWTVSRIDLFTDVQGWPLVAADRERFVCRARDAATYDADGVLTGFGFGKRTSGAAVARIYDKSLEVSQKGTDWWFDKWAPDYAPDERVLRVEFEIGRSMLRQTSLRSPGEVLDGAPGLWGYLTDEWLTFRDPSADKTRSRWPLAAEWTAIQNASLRGDAVGLERVYAGETAGSLRRLLPAVRGYVASTGALLGARTLDETVGRLARVLARDEEASGVPFASRIVDKRIQMGLA